VTRAFEASTGGAGLSPQESFMRRAHYHATRNHLTNNDFKLFQIF
jgi:hypothetical protein